MANPDLTDIEKLKIEVEYLERERQKMLGAIDELTSRLDAMRDSISTKRLEVDGRITTRDIAFISSEKE